MDGRYGERSMDAKIVVMGNTFVFWLFLRDILTQHLRAPFILLQRCWQDQPATSLYPGQI